MGRRYSFGQKLLGTALFLSCVLVGHVVLGNIGSWCGLIVGVFAVSYAMTPIEPPDE